MQHIRVVVSMKRPWLSPASSVGKALCNKVVGDRCLDAPSSLGLMIPTFRCMHVTRATEKVETPEEKKGFFIRMLRKIGSDPEIYRRKMHGYLMYEDIVTNVNYPNFFTDLKLPDTFYSWFVVMELHIWMLMVRCMAEGKPGQVMRNCIVEAMWADVNKRKSKLRGASSSVLSGQLQELSHQFNASIIAYDEGIMSDDKVLAAAIWRRLFQYGCQNPQDLEKIVAFVRKQVNALDAIPSKEFLAKKSIQWMTYENL